MFAPPLPPSGSRPTSAAGHHPYAHQPYDLPSSPLPHETPGLGRRRSLSWRPDAGLPPPPSQIDSLGDSINHALVPAHQDRSHSKSLAFRSPSRYELEFGGLEDPHEHRDRTQMPINSVSKHPKLKIDVVLNSTIFEAGGTVSGKLELTCTTSQKLRLGEIAVDLEGIEELSSRDHAATQLFLYNRTLFQGEHLPPSNAVLPAAPHNGYWTARKGRTTFPFSFRLPATAPSCVTFAGNASLRYHLKATAQTWWQEEKMLVTARREAFVIEKWSDEYDEKYRQPVEAVGDTRLFMGGHGAVWLEAGVTEQLFWGGGQLLIRCGVKNNTKRQVSGIKVCLARRLIFPVGSPDGTHDKSEHNSLEPRITEIVHEQLYKGREYEFPPNEEAVCTVAVDIPRDLRTVRKTRLFEVRTFALVSLVLGSFARDLTVEVPIYVAHTASVQRPAQEDLRDLHPQPAYGPSRPLSSAGHHPHQQHHHHHHGHHPHYGPDAQMLAVEQFAADRGWSPAPIQHQMPSRPSSTAPGMIQLPSTPQPFIMSPSSPGQLQWDPNAGWSASQFLPPAIMGGQIQRSVSAAPVVQQLPRSMSATPDPQVMYAVPPQQYPAWQPPQRAVSASPGPTPQQKQMMAIPTHGRAPTAGSTHLLQQQQGRRASLPSPGPVSFLVPASPAQEQLAHMPEPQNIPPPEKPQLQLDTTPSPSTPLTGLATIEEDSESQAGTVKSISGLATTSKKPNGSPGLSVSLNDIEQFEAIAKAEEDEEQVKRQMQKMGMVPDEKAFASEPSRSHLSQERSRTLTQETLSKPPVPSGKSQASAASRPRASDIFNVAQKAREEGHDAQAAVAAMENRSALTVKDVSPSLRRSESSAGLGLSALESKLVRSTTPKLPSSPSSNVMVMANVGRSDERPSKSSSSRKESALRAAALAREAAKKEMAEKECREEEERKIRLEREEREKQEKERRRRERVAAEEAEQARRDAEERVKRRAREAEEAEKRQLLQRKQEVQLRLQREQEERRVRLQLEEQERQRQREEERARKEAEVAATAKKEQEEAQRRIASSISPRSQLPPSASMPVFDHGALKKEAASRVTGWLSNSSSPNASHLDSPGTPSGSVISMLKKEDASKMAFPSRSPSQVRNPLYSMPKSQTMVNVAGQEAMSRSQTMADVSRQDEMVPTLSADLRALVDGSDVTPARRAGTALRDHPISRKISTTSTTVPPPIEKSVKRDRHTSLPSWPKPGLPTAARPLPGIKTLEHSTPIEKPRTTDLFTASEREIVIPSRVEKTLLRPSGAENCASDSPSYDHRSARGGRGGRVASVASLWSNIAGDTPPELPTATLPPSGTFKPKARRGSAIGGAAPALDFSKKKVSSVAATFTKTESLKSDSAPQFLNTAPPKPIFAKAEPTVVRTVTSHAEKDLKFGGRGTTKSIGQTKLRDLKAVWGN